MSYFTAQEKALIARICEALVPSLAVDGKADDPLYRLSAADLDTPAHVATMLESVAMPEALRELRLILRLWQMPLFNFITSRRWQSLADMSADDIHDMLQAAERSKLFPMRKAFQAFKRSALFMHYSAVDENGHNPTWPSLGYASAPPPQQAPKPIQPLNITEPTTLTADVLVIGSGAGGGVVAGELSMAGFDVLVVEKGDYYAEPDFNRPEVDSYATRFERQGALTTTDTVISVLAGSTLGGGTTINWSASFRTPDDVLAEWAEEYGFEGADGVNFQLSLDAVMQRLNVNTDESIPNPQNTYLEQGCKALGQHVGIIPRNVKGCEDCSYCAFGCTYGAKQGTLKTYLQDAYEHGARIVVRAEVQRVLIERGRAVGALMMVTDANGQQHEVTVKAKAVVVCAGSIHTPAILRRSGLNNPHIGDNLRLHPVAVVFSIFDEPVHPWAGVPMSRYSAEFADLDGRGYGVRLETAPIHPGLSASSVPWNSAKAHRRLMEHFDYIANIIVLARDYYGGRVTVGRDGYPRLHYRLHPYDARHLMRGLTQALEVHKAAGAKEIYTGLAGGRPYRGGSFNAFLADIRKGGFKPHGQALFSAHQMGSCRIAGSSIMGAVRPDGQTYEVRGLYVADASVFPTASGVNPMITIMGTAHYLAQHMKAQL